MAEETWEEMKARHEKMRRDSQEELANWQRQVMHDRYHPKIRWDTGTTVWMIFAILVIVFGVFLVTMTPVGWFTIAVGIFSLCLATKWKLKGF